ncbi:MAG: MATE family efflux transporter [Deltaproteobacteria bacterium]|nr:MATE family efflux transporter [Deltaproteobacteria bacterium]
MTTPPHRAGLTEGPVARQLLGLAAPMVAGVLSVILLAAIDTYFVGKLGADALAAISFTFPVVALIANLTIGLSIGATAAIARAIGTGRESEVKRLTTDALLLAGAIVMFASVIGYLTIDPVFTAMGADATTLPMIREYMGPWYLSIVLLVVPMMGNAALRASGDSMTQARTMIISAILNGILDPILIFGWGPIEGMGVTGAAVASIIARGVAAALTLWVLIRGADLVSFERVPFAEVKASWRQILKVGAPAAATNIVPSVASAMLTRLVSGFGHVAVAAFGAGSRIEQMALILPLALTSALGPFVGQNWGAGHNQRARDAIVLSERLSFGWGLVVWSLLALTAAPIAQRFAGEPDVVAPLQSYLVLATFGLAFQGITFSTSASFNSIAQPLKSTSLALLRTTVLALPLAWIGAQWNGLEGLFVGVAAANILTGLAAFWMARPLRAGVLPDPGAR